MAEIRCKFAVNLTTFTMPLILDFILICIHFWAYNRCVKIKALQFPLEFGGVFLTVLGGVSLLLFLNRNSERYRDCLFCSYKAVAWVFFFAVFFPLYLGMDRITGGSTSDPAEPYSSHPRLDHFSPVLRDRVSDAERWDRIIACLVPSIRCDRLNQTYSSHEQLSSAHLNPLQYQCCMPPLQCGLSFVSPTYWQSPTTNQTYLDADCTTWNNDQTKLCYHCDSCKEAVLAKIKKKWRMAYILFITTCWVLIPISIYNCYCSEITYNW